MCGFGGVLNRQRPIDEAAVRSIASAVSYRGPDSTGVRLFARDFSPAASGPHALFFNRLAIIDLDPRSNQPFEDARYSLLFNGEIYNFRQLRSELEQGGARFHTTSDTEVLFHALRCWGTAALPRLNGMFAFCWLDRQEGRFILARDRVGIKPLYYRRTGGGLAFASELDSVVRLDGQGAEVNTGLLPLYLWFQYVPTPYSAVRGVSKIPPGTCLAGSLADLEQDKTLEPVTYWDAYATAAGNPDPSAPPLRDLLVGSLSGQLIADVPLGCFLSSGVDSSLLTAVINDRWGRDQDFLFFTVAFTEETASDESPAAREFLARFRNPRLRHQTLTIDSGSVGDHLDRLYDFFDEPFGDSASLLNWAISEKARQYVTVVLSGDGGDELFWGYRRYREWLRSRPGAVRRSRPARALTRILGGLPASRNRLRALLRLDDDPLRLYLRQVLPAGFAAADDGTLERLRPWSLRDIEPLRDRPDLPALFDVKAYLLDAMLYKVDRASMATSLEVRVPYLDNAVVEHALRLPLALKTEGGEPKAPLKALLRTLAPHYPAGAAKKGFNFPLGRWLAGQWRDRVLSTVTRERLQDVGLDPRPAMRVLDLHYRKGRPHQDEVWYLLNLLLWHEAFRKKHARLDAAR